MNKKISAVFLIVCMMMTLIACADRQAPDRDGAGTQADSMPSPEQSEAEPQQTGTAQTEPERRTEEETGSAVNPPESMGLPDVWFKSEEVDFAAAKKHFEGLVACDREDFLRYELQIIMPAGRVAGVSYVFRTGELLVHNNTAAGAINIREELCQKKEYQGKTFYVQNEADGKITVYYTGMEPVIYAASFAAGTDAEDVIALMASLLQ